MRPSGNPIGLIHSGAISTLHYWEPPEEAPGCLGGVDAFLWYSTLRWGDWLDIR